MVYWLKGFKKLKQICNREKRRGKKFTCSSSM
jgi:hypothetical protein